VSDVRREASGSSELHVVSNRLGFSQRAPARYRQSPLEIK
jgi:hypothetical protein